LSAETETQQTDGDKPSGNETLTVTDNRTGKTIEVPIEDGTVRAMAFRELKVDEDDFGLMTYDPAYTNTASTRSAITFIDGDKGILEYRGYPIEQLAEKSNYLEVAYLLVHGELPNASELQAWTDEITIHTFVHENVKKFMEGFRYDAHPMGMLCGAVGALSTFYPDANNIKDPENRHIQTIRLIAKMPTLAAFAYRHTQGQPYVYPDNDLSYSGNFLNMMYKMTELKYEPGIPGSSARSTSCSSSTPTTSRTRRRARSGRSARRRSTRTRRSRPASPRCTAPCTAGRTRRSCGCSSASRRPTTSRTSSRASRTATSA
jgi:citrate synthase